MKKFLLSMIVFCLGGCREHELYRYKAFSVNCLEGELLVGIEGSPETYEKDGKKYSIETDPFFLIFNFFRNQELPFDEVSVSNITAVGESGLTIELPSQTSDNVIDRSKWYSKLDKRLEAGVSVRIPTTGNLKYEPYTIEAIFYVSNNGQQYSENIHLTLKTDFKKSKRSDSWDSLMGL